MSSEPSVSGTCLRFRLNSSPTCLSPEFPKEGTWVALVQRRSSIHLKSNLHFLLPSFLFNFPPEKSISVFRELYQSNSGVNNTEKPTLVWFFFFPELTVLSNEWAILGFDLILFLFLILPWGSEQHNVSPGIIATKERKEIHIYWTSGMLTLLTMHLASFNQHNHPLK